MGTVRVAGLGQVRKWETNDQVPPRANPGSWQRAAAPLAGTGSLQPTTLWRVARAGAV